MTNPSLHPPAHRPPAHRGHTAIYLDPEPLLDWWAGLVDPPTLDERTQGILRRARGGSPIELAAVDAFVCRMGMPHMLHVLYDLQEEIDSKEFSKDQL